MLILSTSRIILGKGLGNLRSTVQVDVRPFRVSPLLLWLTFGRFSFRRALITLHLTDFPQFVPTPNAKKGRETENIF